MNVIYHLGLDVHNDSIAISIAPSFSTEVRRYGIFGGTHDDVLKLARILWHMIKYKEAFNPEVFAKEEARMKRKKLARLQTMATDLNYQLIPNP